MIIVEFKKTIPFIFKHYIFRLWKEILSQQRIRHQNLTE